MEDCGVIIEDQEDVEDKNETEESKAESDASKKPGYQIHSESEKKSSKLAAEVKSKMEKMKAGAGDNDSDDDVAGDDSEVERTSENCAKSVITKDENKQKKVDLTSGKSENVKAASDLNVAGNGKIVAANDDSGEINNKSDTKGAIKGNKSGKGNQKGVKFKDDEIKGDRKEKEEEKAEVENIVETELSWKEGNKSSPFNEHRTQCAFNFSNNVMFDLDID